MLLWLSQRPQECLLFPKRFNNKTRTLATSLTSEVGWRWSWQASSYRNCSSTSRSLTCLLLDTEGKCQSPRYISVWTDLPPARTGGIRVHKKPVPGHGLCFYCEVGLSPSLLQLASWGWESLQAPGPQALGNPCGLPYLHLGKSSFGKLPLNSFTSLFTWFQLNNWCSVPSPGEAQLPAPGGWCPCHTCSHQLSSHISWRAVSCVVSTLRSFQSLGKDMGRQELAVRATFNVPPGSKANVFSSWAAFGIIVFTEK